MNDLIDITGKIGPLYSGEKPPEWPMYSYARPAYLVWNHLANRLHEVGWTEEEIRTWLQSKAPRWALDGPLSRLLDEAVDEYLKLEPPTKI